jgi:hypothetical protein
LEVLLTLHYSAQNGIPEPNFIDRERGEERGYSVSKNQTMTQTMSILLSIPHGVNTDLPHNLLQDPPHSQHFPEGKGLSA